MQGEVKNFAGISRANEGDFLGEEGSEWKEGRQAYELRKREAKKRVGLIKKLRREGIRKGIDVLEHL